MTSSLLLHVAIFHGIVQCQPRQQAPDVRAVDGVALLVAPEVVQVVEVVQAVHVDEAEGVVGYRWPLMPGRRLLDANGLVEEHQRPHRVEVVPPADAVQLADERVDAFGVGVGRGFLEVVEDRRAPVVVGRGHLAEGPVDLWRNSLDALHDRTLALAPPRRVVGVCDLLLGVVGLAQERELPQPGIDLLAFAVGQLRPAMVEQMALVLELDPLLGRALASARLPDIVQSVVGHAEEVELVDHDETSWEEHFCECVVGLPHVGHHDLDVVSVRHTGEIFRDVHLRP